MDHYKVFFDMEFTGLHQATTLISIGLITENDETFYAEFDDYDKKQLDPWIQEHVVENLYLTHSSNILNEWMGNTEFIKNNLTAWLRYLMETHDARLEMWSDCLAYDWVLFNNMYGHAFKIPTGVSYIPLDICTMFKLKGIDPDISREQFAETRYKNCPPKKHNALWDAQVIKYCYDKMIQMPYTQYVKIDEQFTV